MKAVCLSPKSNRNLLQSLTIAVVAFYMGRLFGVGCGENVNTDYSNIYTSISHMRMLVRQEALMYNNLKENHDKLERMADLSRKLLKQIKHQVPSPILDEKVAYSEIDFTDDNTNEANFISHPVNSYHVITRMVNDWAELISLAKHITTNINSDLLSVFEKSSSYWPKYSDEIGVIDSIERVRDFTGIEPKKWSSKALLAQHNVPLQKPLEIDDLVKIGLRAYKLSLYGGAVAWLNEAIELMETSAPNYDVYKKSVILDYLAWSQYKNGDLSQAIKNYHTVIKLDPHNFRAKNNIAMFEERLNKAKHQNLLIHHTDLDNLSDKQLNKLKLDSFLKNKTMNRWLKNKMNNVSLPAEDIVKFEFEMAKYVCRHGYLYYNEPWEHQEFSCFNSDGVVDNFYGPYKIEKLHSDPEVFLLRDFLSDEDIEKIKKIAGPRLGRAVVHNPKTNALETANYRISKSSWHSRYEGDVFDKIYRKVEDCTGLSLNYSETFQVQNYGVGGYYDNHFDFSTLKQMENRKVKTGYELLGGNRIATLLFYMTDVAVGGETAFPRLGVRVSPSKGSVLFWYNLLPDGSGDARTRHIACPVVFGTKWVGNHWVRQKGQELRHQCNLQPNNGV